jgi:ABC-2 type transport system ATP-binding protein
MSRPAVVFQNVTRRFGRKVAVGELELTVEPGTVLGLIGRNGAGKTTTLRLAHGLLHPDEGSIRVLELDPVTQGRELRTRVSLLSEESVLYPWMTVEQIIGLAAALHPRWDPALAAELAEKLQLEPATKIKTLSRGTRAKVALVLALSSRPDVLLLDDPTAGLDPLVRREILQGLLETMSEEGGAVVYTSHLVHDIERVADRVAVMDEGRLELEGSLESLKARMRRARAVFEDEDFAAPSLGGLIDLVREGRVLTVVAEAENGDLTAELRRAGAKEIEVEPLSLEEILVAYLRRGGAAEDDHV